MNMLTKVKLPTFSLTIRDNRIWVSEIGDLNGTVQEFLAHRDKTLRVVGSSDDLRLFLSSKANEFGVSVGDLRVLSSSSLDFPECETDNPATIALAREIRDPDWNWHLSAKHIEK